MVVTILCLAGLAVWWWSTTLVGLELTGPEGGPIELVALPPDEASARPLLVVVEPASYADRATVTLAGVPVREVARAEGRLTIRLEDGLPEAGYELAVTVDRPFPLRSTTARWPVAIDGQPPALAAPSLTPVAIDAPVVLTGAMEPGATLAVQADSVEPPQVDVAEGMYRVAFSRAPAGAVELAATDLAGNTATVSFDVPVAYPADTRAVHVSAAAWGDAELRRSILDLVDRGVVNAVQLDLKDEDGVVGYDSDLPMVAEVGARQAHYDLADAVELLKGRNVRVIGRIVAFRDPLLADWAWAKGHRDWVLQTPTGEPLAAYGGFTNYNVAEVRAYNLAIAEEAAAAGVGDILWDYIRRPEGDPTEMVVPGLTGTKRTTGDAITEFLAESHLVLRRAGAYQGASLFGIAALRPENIGQPVDRISREVDYVAPMVYPSHYVDGECGVASPIRQPYDIVACSLRDFVEVMEGSGAVLVPWLQDFTLGSVPYGAFEVAEQIRAARDVGAVGFLLWNPSARYSLTG